MAWYEALHQLQRAARPHALASVIGTAGSTPRNPGAKMVITADQIYDTLGGGTFEYQVIEAARSALAREEQGPLLEPFALGGRSGQCCGGYVHVLIELFSGAEMTVAVFGAGHIGQALVRLLGPLPWRIIWSDSRPDGFPEWSADQPRLSCRYSPDPAAAVATLPAASHSLVMTHDHTEDRVLIDALLKRNDCASIGLIGSQSKWASFKRRLKEVGHAQSALEQVRCPIGIAGAHGKHPYEIALAVSAELLFLKKQPVTADRRGVEPKLLNTLFAARSAESTQPGRAGERHE